MIFPIAAVMGLCKVCTAIGGTVFCVHKVTKAYGKHSKRKKEKLALKGKTIEQAREDNNKLNDRNQELEDKLNKGEDKEREIEKQVNDIKKELEDPNITKQREEELRTQLGFLQTQLDELRINNKGYRDEIKRNNKQIGDNNRLANKTASNLEDRHWIWELVTLENILIVGGCYVLYKLLKEEKDKK